MTTKQGWTTRKLFIVFMSVLATILATLVVVNFTAGENTIEEKIPHLYGAADPQFERSMGALLGAQIVDGNKFDAMLNGDQIFPAMLAAIRSARETINFETYIYWSEEIGKEFADALAERARAGVKVHVLLDWVGSAKMEQARIDEMTRAGVEVRKYHPLRWYTLGRINNRTHRKLLITDGRIGFTGGVGIAGQWTGNGEDPDHWRDSHFRVQGPVVKQVQAVFLENWTKTTGEVLHGDLYFPPLPSVGTGRAQMFSSSPTSGSEKMHLMYLMAITAAQKSIDLSASYFVPDDMTRHALIDAMKRGVKLRIITPGKYIDTETVRGSSRGLWGGMLRAGAEISEYQPTMYHCKVMIVDGLMVSVGSTNFDDRSFKLNDEANLNIYYADFARHQTAVFEDDLGRSKRITLQDWENRPFKEKALERVLAALGPLL